MAAETTDKILGGMLTIMQPRAGYRFAIDAILLGRFAQPRSRDRVLELGAGCGVVSIMLAALYHPREVVALELQSDLAEMAARNATLNDLGLVRTICADLRTRRIEGLEPATFDLVVANPPYRALRTGRESPNHSRSIARGERGATLAEFVAAAARYASDRAKATFVFTAARSAELIATLSAHALEPKRIRFVHPRIGMPASTILVEARKGGGVEAEVEPPLALYSRAGVYTDEARELLGTALLPGTRP
jgi:tRNA1Val (adenine37-N6)-methyltransferase